MIFIPYQGVKRKMQAFCYSSTNCSLHNVLHRTKMLWKMFLNLEKQYHFVLFMGETQALTHLFHSCTQIRSLLSQLRQLSKLDKQPSNTSQSAIFVINYHEVNNQLINHVTLIFKLYIN